MMSESAVPESEFGPPAPRSRGRPAKGHGGGRVPNPKKQRIITLSTRDPTFRGRMCSYCASIGMSMSAWACHVLDREIKARNPGFDSEGSGPTGPVPEAKPCRSRKVASEIASSEAQIDKLLDEQAVRLLQKNQNLLESLDPAKQADFILRRAPKPVNQDSDLVSSALSLRVSLEHLPEVPDLDLELRLAKARVSELVARVRMQEARCRLLESDVRESGSELPKFGLAVFKAAKEHALTLDALGFERALNGLSYGYAKSRGLDDHERYSASSFESFPDGLVEGVLDRPHPTNVFATASLSESGSESEDPEEDE